MPTSTTKELQLKKGVVVPLRACVSCDLARLCRHHRNQQLLVEFNTILETATPDSATNFGMLELRCLGKNDLWWVGKTLKRRKVLIGEEERLFAMEWWL